MIQESLQRVNRFIKSNDSVLPPSLPIRMSNEFEMEGDVESSKDNLLLKSEGEVKQVEEMTLLEEDSLSEDLLEEDSLSEDLLEEDSLSEDLLEDSLSDLLEEDSLSEDLLEEDSLSEDLLEEDSLSEDLLERFVV